MWAVRLAVRRHADHVLAAQRAFVDARGRDPDVAVIVADGEIAAAGGGHAIAVDAADRLQNLIAWRDVADGGTHPYILPRAFRLAARNRANFGVQPVLPRLTANGATALFRDPKPTCARRFDLTPAVTRVRMRLMNRAYVCALICASGLAAAEPPKSWIDPDTGHRVVRLTRRAQQRQPLLQPERVYRRRQGDGLHHARRHQRARPGHRRGA